VDWRRTLYTNNGQVITPFLRVRGDIASLEAQTAPGMSNYIPTGQTEPARFMPAAGAEYRYPFVDVEPWGTQTVEPIAQLILRPNETEIGKFPNEDAQNLVFSTANLFSIDKFSGWDRVEGGGRINAGLQYTAQVNRAGSLTMLFGESYQLFGLNSYSAVDISNTGLESGLDKRASDYVGSVTYQPNQIFSLAGRGRFDQQTFTPQRLELEGRANFERWTLQLLYGDYAQQPEIGFLNRREEILAGASFKVTQNWVLIGAARYNLAAGQFDQTRLGVGYVDDCLLFSFNYYSYFTYTGIPAAFQNNSFVLQLSLRTLGPDAISPVGLGY
jgi:LPS-assembly protein